MDTKSPRKKWPRRTTARVPLFLVITLLFIITVAFSNFYRSRLVGIRSPVFRQPSLQRLQMIEQPLSPSIVCDEVVRHDARDYCMMDVQFPTTSNPLQFGQPLQPYDLILGLTHHKTGDLHPPCQPRPHI